MSASILKSSILKSSVAAVALAMGATATSAADWQPAGPVKLMIAFRAGGGADTQARLLAEDIKTRHGWNLIPENVTGKAASRWPRSSRTSRPTGSRSGSP